MNLKIIDNLTHRTFINSARLNHVSKIKNCLFLDRDGVMIKDCNYISDPEDVEIMPGLKDILKYASNSGWLIVVVTNQSGISRGYFNWDNFEAVNSRMFSLISKSCKIDAIYANGYGPNEVSDNWRKPNPQMLFEAAKDLKINLSKSVIIGDRLSDIRAGISAGLKMIIHLETGHGLKERGKVIKYMKENMVQTSKSKKLPFMFDKFNYKILMLRELSNIPLQIFEKC